MAIKEKDLPVAGSIATTDYIRMVAENGTSEIIQYADIRQFTPTEKTKVLNAADGKIQFDRYADPGTVDGDLYAAIYALGWQDDVIE